MKKVVLIASLVTTLSATNVAADGKALYASLGCAACHGNAGISAVPTYPNLAGQQAAYIVKQLKDFQSGARKDPTMTAMAALTAGKEQAIADYLASLK
jgi:cytochrome c553